VPLKPLASICNRRLTDGVSQEAFYRKTTLAHDGSKSADYGFDSPVTMVLYLLGWSANHCFPESLEAGLLGRANLPHRHANAPGPRRTISSARMPGSGAA